MTYEQAELLLQRRLRKTEMQMIDHFGSDKEFKWYKDNNGKLAASKTGREARFEVKPVQDNFKVWDNKTNVWITIEVSDKKTADEICHDFNEMDKKNYTSIGLPDFSNKEAKK